MNVLMYICMSKYNVNIRLTFHTLILCNDILHFMFLVIVCMFYFISYSMID